jgi:hypothetical protein
VGAYHTDGAPGLDFLDKHSQATGNAQAPDRESLRHACVGKATIMLFSRHKVAYERKREIMRNVASIAEPKILKFEMRQKLAREPFEEKIRKVGQLIRLAKGFAKRGSRSGETGRSAK